MARAELHRIGVAGRFALYDLDYYFSSEDGGNYFAAESVLLQSSPGLYYELLYRGPFGDLPKISGFAVLPAFTAISGNETIIAGRTNYGGTDGEFSVEYFLFTPTGLKRIDPKPIFDAAETQLPENSHTYFIASRFDFPRETWEVCVQPNDLKGSRKTMGCSGMIHVRFEIRGGAFVVIGAVLKPNLTLP